MTTRLFTLIAVVLTTALLFGCGDDEQASSETPSAEASASTESDALPEPISAEGAEHSKLSDRLLTHLTISEGPDWMVPGFGSLWIKRDNGAVVRVDPDTGKVIANVSPPGGKQGFGPVGEHLCQGIGASDEAIWSCPQPGSLVRIDPKTNSVSANIRIEKVPDQGRIVSAADQVWLLTGDGTKLTGIDPDTNEPSTTVTLDLRCADLAASEATVWVMCPFDGKVLKVDAVNGEVSDELDLAGATNAAVGDDLWVAFEGGAAQVDPETLEVLAVYDLSVRYGGAMFPTADAVWVRQEDEFLTRIDPVEQRIVETIEARDLPSGGDVVQIGDSVWATAYNDQSAVELRATGE